MIFPLIDSLSERESRRLGKREKIDFWRKEEKVSKSKRKRKGEKRKRDYMGCFITHMIIKRKKGENTGQGEISVMMITTMSWQLREKSRLAQK